MATNSLGDFEFVTFHNPQDRGAPPILPAHVGEPIQRPGVDGTSVMRLGVKAEPFPMRSGVDVLTFDAANDLLAEYQASANVEPLPLVWGGVNYHSGYGVLYVPLRVEPLRIRRITGATGGLLGSTATAWLEALWTLQPIATAVFESEA